MMILEKLSPIWPVRSIDAAETFYSRLGFTTVYKDAAQYLIIKREGAEIHAVLHRDHTPAESWHGAYVRPSDVNALSEEWAALGLPTEGIPRFVPAEDKPWGMRECALVDIDGHLLRAGQELPLG